MKDILHIPEGNDDLSEFKCSRCGMEIPQPIAIAAAGMDVVEIGGGLGFVPADGTPGVIQCTASAAEKEREQADAVDELWVDDAEAPELGPGETKKEARPLGRVEKMANSQGFQNFLQMREMSRPEEKR